MSVEMSFPEAAWSSPTGEFHAAVPPTAQPSAPSYRGSMSSIAARPVSFVAGMDQRTWPVSASRNVAPRLPDFAISPWGANTSRRGGGRAKGDLALLAPGPVVHRELVIALAGELLAGPVAVEDPPL